MAQFAGANPLFDDRLATVLRTRAQSEASARTQFRQLLDLLGTTDQPGGDLVDAAYQRLADLTDTLPATVQSAILRAPGIRLRSRALVAWLAEQEPQAAAAAMATAQLSERDWFQLIPRLPMTARGFLRHRRDLPASARQILERLGIGDLVLPLPDRAAFAQTTGIDTPIAAAPLPAPAPGAGPVPAGEAGIGALVRRIEAFQKARREAPPAIAPPVQVLPDSRRAPGDAAERACFDFATDHAGEVTWAEAEFAPAMVGRVLFDQAKGSTSQLDRANASAARQHRPLRGGQLWLDGPERIAGSWRIDAAPMFDDLTGRYTGYCGRLRRPAVELARATADSAPDRMRQVLHELRTPVNAVQGFAELIQQQMFGPVPNEYRALAAGIAVDAARLLAGFEELERLAQLDSGALALEPGDSDLRMIAAELVRRLDGVLRPRNARIELAVAGSPFSVALANEEAQQLVWRLLATLAGALGPNETIQCTLQGNGQIVSLDSELPGALRAQDELFAALVAPQARAISAGMFGPGFALRLARAEAQSAGGDLRRADGQLQLTLPALTTPAATHRAEHER